MDNISRIKPYLRLMRLHQPIGFFLLLWPTLWALLVASRGRPSLKFLTLFSLGVFLSRSLGCVINDIADRNFDKLVTRTQFRPLATGAISLKSAQQILVFLVGLAFIVVLQLNRLTIGLSLIGLFLMGVYPYTKRYIHCPQLVLGLAFAWSIPMAFSAQTGKIPIVAWILYSSGILWPLAYDTIYAMVDRKDDHFIGLKSTALWLGHFDRLFIAIVHFLFLISLIYAGIELQLEKTYYIMLSFSGILLVYQHYLIKDRIPVDCFKAFLNNAWVGALITLGFIFGFLIQ